MISSNSKDKDKSSKHKKRAFILSLSSSENATNDSNKDPSSTPPDTTVPVNISVIDPNHTPQKHATVTTPSARQTSSSGLLSRSMDKVKIKRKESRELVLQSVGGAINEEPEPVSARLDMSVMCSTPSERLAANLNDSELEGESTKEDKRHSEPRRKKHNSLSPDESAAQDDEQADKLSKIDETTPVNESNRTDNLQISPSDEISSSKNSDDIITNKDTSGSLSQSSPVLSRNRIKMATINIQLADKKEKSPRSPRKSPRHVSDDLGIKEIKEKELKMLREHTEVLVTPVDPLPTESPSAAVADEGADHLTVPALDSGPKSAAPQRLINKRVGHRRVKSFDVDKLPYAAGINPDTLSPRTDNALQLKVELAQKRLVRVHKYSITIHLIALFAPNRTKT